jgi:hypothetical protein
MDSASLAQVAVIGGLALGAATIAAKEVRRRVKPSELAESDVKKALDAKSAMRASGRLREVRKPEWQRRLEAMWRLGERKRRREAA